MNQCRGELLAKLYLCSICSQNLNECSLASAPKIFGVARMLAFLSDQCRKEVKDRPARTPNAVFVVASHYQMPSRYIFVLTSMFVGYDRRSFKNCFQQRLIFYKAPVCHQCLFKILYRWVTSCNKRQ